MGALGDIGDYGEVVALWDMMAAFGWQQLGGGLDGVVMGVGGTRRGHWGHLGTLGALWGGVALGTQGHEGDRRTWFGGRGHPGGNEVAVGGHMVTLGDTW